MCCKLPVIHNFFFGNPADNLLVDETEVVIRTVDTTVIVVQLSRILEYRHYRDMRQQWCVEDITVIHAVGIRRYVNPYIRLVLASLPIFVILERLDGCVIDERILFVDRSYVVYGL